MIRKKTKELVTEIRWPELIVSNVGLMFCHEYLETDFYNVNELKKTGSSTNIGHQV